MAPHPGIRSGALEAEFTVSSTSVEASTATAGVRTEPAGRFRTFSAQMLVTFAALSAAAVALLPHDKYLRYQVPNDPQAPTSDWIYERIHFDPTPIDVAFIGTSRTGMSIHSRRLEDDLAQSGIHANAVTLYCVRSGMNMQYVVAKELLSTRKVKLLVLEMTEREERKPHELFYQYADTVDVLTAPLLINFNYLSDIARLPGRQVRLSWQTLLQRLGLRQPEKSAPPYEGPHLDHAEFVRSVDNVVHSRSVRHTEAEMEQMRIADERAFTRPLLPKSMSALEYRLARYYESKILDLAREQGVRVVFLYTPRYGGPSTPPPYALYSARADLINPWPLIHRYPYWNDANHMNWYGAQIMTDYVADVLRDAHLGPMESELKVQKRSGLIEALAGDEQQQAADHRPAQVGTP